MLGVPHQSTEGALGMGVRDCIFSEGRELFLVLGLLAGRVFRNRLCSCSAVGPQIPDPETGTEKTMTARDVTGFHVFSPGNRAILSTFWCDFLTGLPGEPGEKGKNIHRRKFKNPVETAP